MKHSCGTDLHQDPQSNPFVGFGSKALALRAELFLRVPTFRRRKQVAAHTAGTKIDYARRSAGFKRVAPVRGDAPKQPSVGSAGHRGVSRAAKRQPRVNDNKHFGGSPWSPAPT